MIRILLVMVLSALGVAGPFAPVSAQDRKEPSPKAEPAPSLKVGDPAPALKATKWLQGDPVTKFEPGKVYVVEFWAAWCGSCIRHMPHLAVLQERFNNHSLTVIGFTCRDILGGSDNNPEERVAAFVKRRGPMLKYTFAYADDATAADAWLKGENHFPVFVVDKSGRIAYRGSPLFLDLVLPKVLAGGASAQAIGEEAAKAVAEYEAMFATLERDRDHEQFLRALTEFEKRYPSLADSLPAAGVKLGFLLKNGIDGEDEKYAKVLVTKATEHNNVFMLELLYVQLHDKKESKELLGQAVRAAEALTRVYGGKDAQSLIRLAEAYFVSGDKARAKEYARRAIEAAAREPSAFRQGIEKQARKLGVEK